MLDRGVGGAKLQFLHNVALIMYNIAFRNETFCLITVNLSKLFACSTCILKTLAHTCFSPSALQEQWWWQPRLHTKLALSSQGAEKWTEHEQPAAQAGRAEVLHPCKISAQKYGWAWNFCCWSTLNKWCQHVQQSCKNPPEYTRWR